MVKHREEARTLALKAASEKAVAMARTMGVTLGSVYSLEEETPVGDSFQQINLVNYVTKSGTDVESGPSVALGQLSIIERVTLRFELK